MCVLFISHTFSRQYNSPNNPNNLGNPRELTLTGGKTSTAKQLVSLRTLGQIISNTGYVVKPCLEYPTLLPTLLNVLQSSRHGLRGEVLKVLGRYLSLSLSFFKKKLGVIRVIMFLR